MKCITELKPWVFILIHDTARLLLKNENYITLLDLEFMFVYIERNVIKFALQRFHVLRLSS